MAAYSGAPLMTQNKGPYNLDVIESCYGCVMREEGLFCRLPQGPLTALNSLRQTSFFPKGAILFVEGQAARGLYVLCSGQAKLTATSVEGQSLTFRIAESGEVLGLSCVIAEDRYPATAETQCPCQVSFIPRLEFMQFLRSNPDVALTVAKHLSMELNKAWQQARLLALSPGTQAKLVQFLLNWATLHGQASSDGVHIALNMTHEELARHIGASRESVSRILSDLKHQGLIRISGGTVIVSRPVDLQALVNA